MNSVATPVEIICGGCEHRYLWDVWLLVDGRERADLEARFAAGELHEFHCPQCGSAGAASAPVVIIRADGSTSVRLQAGVASERNAEFLAQLVQHAASPEQAAELYRLLESATFEEVETVAEAPAPVPASGDGVVGMPGELADAVGGASRLLDEHLQSGDLRTLADATVAWKAIISSEAFGKAPGTFRTAAYNSLALCYQHRYLATGDERQTQRAHSLWLAALDEAEPGTEGHRLYANNAGLGEADSFKRNFVLDRIDESIRLLSLACDSGCAPGPRLGDSLRNLATSLFARFQATGRSEDLDEAIARTQSAIKMFEPGDPRTSESLSNLGLILVMKFRSTQDPEALESALASQRRALELCAAPVRSVVESNLAEALLARHEFLGNPEDLAESISILRRADDRPSPEPRVALQVKHNLGVALVRQYYMSGDESCLEEATNLFDQADAAGDASFISLARASLGRALAEAYHRTGRPELLDRAIYTLRLAAVNAPVGDPMNSGVFHSLGIVLDDRFSRWNRPEDLSEALENLRRAVEISEAAGRIDSKLLCSLAIVLNRVYKASGQEEHLTALLTVGREAVAASQSETPGDQSAACLALATGLHAAYGARKDPALLLEAIEWTKAAEQTALPSRRFAVETALAGRLRDFYEWERSEESLSRAIEAYRTAIAAGLPLHPAGVLSQAISWGAWAMSRLSWEEAAEAARVAIMAADQLEKSQGSLQYQDYWLEESAEVHEALAYSLARCGDLRGAITAVEAGRARTIYRRIEQTRASNALPKDASEPRDGFPYTEWNVDRAYLSFEEVLLAAADGCPLVYFITIPQGALALVVEPAADIAASEVRAIWFDAYSAATSHALLIEDSQGHPGWLTAYLAWSLGTMGSEQLEPVLEALSGVLAKLWEAVIGLVVDDLVARGFSAAMFLPSPVLSLLPLHAAQNPTTGRTVLDNLSISYAPCLTALIACREEEYDTRSATALAVADDRECGPLPELPFSSIEADIIAGYFLKCTRLNASSSSVAEVSAQIQVSDVLHFACHGQTDHEHPLRSGISIAKDGELTLGELLELPPRRHRLAILAGCETGLVSLSALHRRVSLTSGFLVAGCQGVIASLWVLPDWCSALLLCRMFDIWGMSGSNLASSFREAQLWIRDTT